MNTITFIGFYEDELHIVTSALQARYAQQVWAQQFGQAREIEYVIEKIRELVGPVHSDWYWVEIADDVANVYSVFPQEGEGPLYIDLSHPDMVDWVGPFSTEKAAIEVADAFNSDDQPPQTWWWLDISGGYVSYHAASEVRYIYPSTFAHDCMHFWEGPYSREEVARFRADDLNAFRGYYDAS